MNQTITARAALARAKAPPCGKPLGEVVYCNVKHEEKHPPDAP